MCAGLNVSPLIADTAPRIASINLCADQLLLMLADPEQILTLSNLSHNKSGSWFYEKARQYPTNTGTSEEVFPLNPDVVLAGAFDTQNTVTLLRQLGMQVEVMQVATTLEDVFSNIRIVAKAAGKAQKGEKVIADMQKRLASFSVPDSDKPLAAVYDPNGYTVGPATLRGQMIELSGWENAATRMNIQHYGSIPLETLVRMAPAALIDSPYSPGTYSRAQALSAHPALRDSRHKRRTITLPSRMTICAGPWTLDAIEILQQARLAMNSTVEQD